MDRTPIGFLIDFSSCTASSTTTSLSLVAPIYYDNVLYYVICSWSVTVHIIIMQIDHM